MVKGEEMEDDSTLGNSPHLDSFLGDIKTIPNLLKRSDKPILFIENGNDSKQENEEPAYMHIMQTNSTVFKEHINATATQLFPHLDITPESVTILNNFLQDTLVWCILESGKHADRDGSRTILSHHMHSTLRKLLHTSKDPLHQSDTSSCLSSSSGISSPSVTPDRTPPTTPTSSFVNLSDADSGVLPTTPTSSETPHANGVKGVVVPPLEYIITKRLFVETVLTPSASISHSQSPTSYFLVIDHAYARFENMLTDPKWGNPVFMDDALMWKREVRGSTITMKAEGEISRSAKEVFAVILDFQNMRKWNHVLFEYKVIELLDKQTYIGYQRYQSTHCLLKSERDFCTVLHFMLKDGVYTLVSQSIEHEKCPPMKGITRGKMNSSGYRVVPCGEGKCKVTYLVDVDLVYVPTVVVGVMQQQLNVVPRLRRYMAKFPTSSPSHASPNTSRSSSPSHSRSSSPHATPSLSPSPSATSSCASPDGSSSSIIAEQGVILSSYNT